MTRIFFTSDVHGSDPCFMKFVNSAKFYKADVLILGGDITGKMIVPIVEQTDGAYLTEYLGIPRTLKSPKEHDELEKKIRSNGYYPYRTNPTEVAELEASKEKLDQLFSKVMTDDVKRWITVAETRLKDSNVKCYVSPGNDDRFEIDPILEPSSEIICPEDQVVWIDKDHEMITCAWSNITPWNSPRQTNEEKLTAMYAQLTSKVTRMENCIFNLHCPPYDTQLDQAPELDANMKPVTKGGGVSMVHVGSTAVRQAIEKHKPLLGLLGHIHESRGIATIGRTLCINPGSTYGDGTLLGALINLDQKGVKSYVLTQG